MPAWRALQEKRRYKWIVSPNARKLPEDSTYASTESKLSPIQETHYDLPELISVPVEDKECENPVYEALLPGNKCISEPFKFNAANRINFSLNKDKDYKC